MKNIIAILLLSIILSCNAQNTTYKPKAIEMNNKAVNMVSKSFGDVDQIKKALVILDSAINLDTTYDFAYQNKANYLCKLKEYDSAIKTLDKVILLHKNTEVVLSLQGFMLEKIGKEKDALAKYQAAFTEYEQLIKEFPNKVEYQVNQAFLLEFLINKEATQKRFAEILKKYPDDKNVNSIISFLNTIDKNHYIDSICQ